MLELSLWCYASLLIILGSSLQTAVGFGLALLAAPGLYLIDPMLVPGPLVSLAFILSIFNTISNRAQLQLGELMTAVWGRIPGTFLGVYLLIIASQAQLALIIGCCVILAVVISLTKIHITPNPRALLIAGFFSGLIGSAASIGGPPIALVYQHQTAAHIRAQLSAYFLIGCALSLLAYLIMGQMHTSHWLKTAQLTPPLILGYYLGRLGVSVLQTAWIRPIILIICLFSGVSAIIHGVKLL